MQYAVENEELSQHLVAAKDAQRQLTAEVTPRLHRRFFHVHRLTGYFQTREQLQELEEKYSECIEMLHEAQEELKNLRNRNYPAGTPRRYHPLGLYPMVRPDASLEFPFSSVFRIPHGFLCSRIHWQLRSRER